MNRINTIFFDVGGTLNYRVDLTDDERRDYFKKIINIIGLDKNISIDDFIAEVDARDKKYKKWSLKTWIELSEAEICSKWLFPDHDFKLLSDNAEELVLLYNASKGNRIYRDDVKTVVRELKRRGYKIGAITNTVSVSLVPFEFEREGITEYFDVVIKSSDSGIRKPDPKIFHLALDEIGSRGIETLYVGDAPNRDVEGPKRADWAKTVVLDPKGKYTMESVEHDLYRPDYFIKSLSELLDMCKGPDKL